MYDIAIIGAGPAGTILARELARKNEKLNILLVDGSEGHEKVCGGLLSPDAQKVLDELGLTLPEDVLCATQTDRVETIDLTAGVTTVYPRDYINMDRQAFDAWLLSELPRSVCVVSARCISVESGRDHFKITLREGDVTDEIESTVVVGADGASSIVRRCLYPDSKPMKYISIQEWYDLPDESLPVFTCIYDKKTTDSCSWTIRKENDFIFGGAFAENGCREAFDEQKKRLEGHFGMEFGEAKKREACLVVSPRKSSDFLTGENGAYLVGEAAGFISSSSFEGISSALTSGKILAQCISDSLVYEEITESYLARTKKLRKKLALKIPKMRILTNPFLRKLIMKSGITAIK